ncbi:hypothetical protein [Psychrobacillus sp.]|uniref:hypothetical protein n=1 Tax=Psychrobacillus sp. TaxID=1871623 RepID=UPI0028BEAF53|nr:hypothetical protein [Psychrobacillus sp.]
MKKGLMVIPMVLLIAAGCSDETVDVVEQSNKKEDTVVVEKETPKETTTVESGTTKKVAKDEPKEVTPATGSVEDGEPMDDISEEDYLKSYYDSAEKVGYVTNIEKTNAGNQLTVDFAEFVIDNSHDVGFYVANKEVGKVIVIVGDNVQLYVLNGTELSVTSIENIANKKGALFAFLYDDANKLFMIEEKYLP